MNARRKKELKEKLNNNEGRENVGGNALRNK
jgi:hypothetical protein